LSGSRVDLLALIDNGIPERKWLPASRQMLARAARHHIAAPMKSGKSLGLLTHVVNMVDAGARVTILDRENGADEYARRLKAILANRPPKTREAVRERLTYHAWPRLQLEDRDAIAGTWPAPTSSSSTPPARSCPHSA
jgi:hypothetical protein